MLRVLDWADEFFENLAVEKIDYLTIFQFQHLGCELLPILLKAPLFIVLQVNLSSL